MPYQESGITFSLEALLDDSTIPQTCRVVDFDNDRQLECVKKTIWWPSSMSTELDLIADIYKEYHSYVQKINVRFPCFYDVNRVNTNALGTPVKNKEIFIETPMQLWFEKFDEKVYTFYLNRIQGSSDMILEVSLIENETLSPLLQYLLIADKEYTLEEYNMDEFQ